MVYKVLGIMSGSSLDGLDIAYVHLHARAGQWAYTIEQAETRAYSSEWVGRLDGAKELGAEAYLTLHTAYGRFIGEQITAFIRDHGLDFQVQLIASHGHTVFHAPEARMTAQLGDGAAIAAVTGLPVVSDLRAMDVALGGQGAPLVPIGEKWLFPGYEYYLNLGGIANLTVGTPATFLAFDVCPANRVLNLLAALKGKPFDHQGEGAASGSIDPPLLAALEKLDYYRKAPPKSLSNEFGTYIYDELIRTSGCSPNDGLRTYSEHIALRVSDALQDHPPGKLLVTGGGAHNLFLIKRLGELLAPSGILPVIPESKVVDYKEALIMGLIGVLRLRQEDNALASVTGADRDSVGGALWNGQ